MLPLDARETLPDGTEIHGVDDLRGRWEFVVTEGSDVIVERVVEYGRRLRAFAME